MLIFTAISVFFVALTFDATKGQISQNEKQLLAQRLGELVSNYDNDIINEKYVKNINLHGLRQNISIFPAKRNQQIFAYIIEHTYPNGYNGNIKLLTGIDSQQQLLGVRVIAHRETPGLGDQIDLRKSNWIRRFSGFSLTNPLGKNWKVKPDGGIFDAFTGATITPRAVVTATFQLLDKFSIRPCLFQNPACN